MDTNSHTFSSLFRQLRLPAGRDDVVTFLTQHHLEEGTALPDAPFWNPTQANSLREALVGDSDWAEQVDELVSQLTRRKNAN